MDWSLIIFAVVILLFAWRGFRGGFLKALGRVFAVLAGYAAAILYSGPLSSWVEMQFGWQGVVTFVGTSLTLFLAGGLAMMLIVALLRRFLFPGDDISIMSALGGGFVGTLVGVLLAIAIVWSFAFVRDMRSPSTTTATETAASEHSSRIEKLANLLTGSAVRAAMNAGSVTPEVARLSGALAAAPAKAMQRTQRLMKSTEFLALMDDPRNRRVLDSGNPQRVQQLPAFRALAVNPDMLALGEMSGLADDDLEAEFARQLTDTWGRAQQIKNDPRVQAILADPEFQAALDSGNPIDLLTNHQLHELADIIYADEATAATSGQSTAGTSAVKPSKEPAEIHQ
jgi:hypothetical protein